MGESPAREPWQVLVDSVSIVLGCSSVQVGLNRRFVWLKSYLVGGLENPRKTIGKL